MFDVDCPRTPDGGDDDPKNGNTKPKPTSSSSSSTFGNNKPPRPSSITPRGSVRKGGTPRGGTRKNYSFSPRFASSRKTPSSGGGGLEPEEYIAPPPPAPDAMGVVTSPRPPRAPNSGGGLARGVGAPNSGGGSVSAYRAAPNSGNGAGSTNPFDDVNVNSNDNSNGNNNSNDGEHSNRGRTNSGTWWKEDIIAEGNNKGEAMEEYYGLKPGEKEDLYGPTPAVNTDGGRNPFDDERGMPAQQQHHQQQLAGGTHDGIPVQNNSTVKNNNTSSPTNNNAAGGGYVDDYSFSNVNLSSPSNSPGIASPGAAVTASAAIRSLATSPNSKKVKLQEWWRSSITSITNNFSKQNGGDGSYLPPGMTSESNIAPRPRNSSANEWYPNSPKVTFTNDFHPASLNNPNKRSKKDKYWNDLSPVQKMGVAVIWVALVCTVFGVMISGLKTSPADINGGGSQAVSMPELGSDTAWPEETPEPTSNPTLEPTVSTRPTKDPTTDAPIGGYQGLHSKEYDGTSRPTRNPVTVSPSESPTTAEPTTSSPTGPPSGAPTTAVPSQAPFVMIESVQQFATLEEDSSSSSCTDEGGEFSNHNSNPKTCEWLGAKGGLTDRKDKNCGGVPIADEDTGGTVVYPTSELGSKCRMTCALYNECPDEDAAVGGSSSSSSSLSLMMGNGVDEACTDENGEYPNHLENDKTCEWLAAKAGYSDRKDKNCGGRPVVDEFTGGTFVYPTTMLGNMCRATCGLYNDCPTSSDDDAAAAAAGGSFSAANGSQGKDSRSVCTDSNGDYRNHLQNHKNCEWLDNKEGYSDRKDKNCGGRIVVDEFGNTKIYSTTELGNNCQETCGLYNGCASTREVDRPVPVQVNKCRDRGSEFFNHLKIKKDCEWLYNGKKGKTDRKDKNCGSRQYPKTDLGKACAETCMDYHDDCKVTGKLSVENGIRSFSSPSYSFSLTEPGSSSSGAECMNGEGKYVDHKRRSKPCTWLVMHGEERHGNDSITKHRQEKNCGSTASGHAITELGRECPWSCKEYNDCGT